MLKWVWLVERLVVMVRLRNDFFLNLVIFILIPPIFFTLYQPQGGPDLSALFNGWVFSC